VTLSRATQEPADSPPPRPSAGRRVGTVSGAVRSAGRWCIAGPETGNGRDNGEGTERDKNRRGRDDAFFVRFAAAAPRSRRRDLACTRSKRVRPVSRMYDAVTRNAKNTMTGEFMGFFLLVFVFVFFFLENARYICSIARTRVFYYIVLSTVTGRLLRTSDTNPSL